MPNINNCRITGRLGRDVELRYTQSGMPLASFSLANNHRTGAGENAKDITTWFNVKAFKKTAEAIARCAKGTEMYVEGRIQENKFTGKDGTEKKTIEIVANYAWPLPSAPKADTGEAGARASAATTEPAEDDSQVPF